MSDICNVRVCICIYVVCVRVCMYVCDILGITLTMFIKDVFLVYWYMYYAFEVSIPHGLLHRTTAVGPCTYLSSTPRELKVNLWEYPQNPILLI